MLEEQDGNTPRPQWMQVVGGWSETQFAEKRLPRPQEINATAPETPVFVLNLYNKAFPNRAARVPGYTRDTTQPPGAIIERDARGEPTGLLLASPMPSCSTTRWLRALGSASRTKSTRHCISCARRTAWA